MKYFLEVRLKQNSFKPYSKLNKNVYAKISNLASEMSSVNIVHINSTSEGGGVADLLKNQVALEKSLGMNSRWLVLRQPSRFFTITKKIHNLLQGGKGGLNVSEKNFYLTRLRLGGKELNNFVGKLTKTAVLILHDAQTLPLAAFLPAKIPSVSRMHIDLSNPNTSALNFLKPYFKKSRIVILSHPSFRPSWLNIKKTFISYPAINPFSKKNIEIDKPEIINKLTDFGLDIKRPIIVQISRFDKWKDPEGVIEAYYLAKKQLPGLQLVLEGSLAAADDPEAKNLYLKLKHIYGKDPDLFLNGPCEKSNKYGEQWINILQRGANIVIQKSIKEGFGLTVAEALWKNKAVIGGNTLGINLQIKNARTGFTVSSPAECSQRIVQLLEHPKLAERLGRRGHKLVKKKFLFDRLIFDFLKVYKNLS